VPDSDISNEAAAGIEAAEAAREERAAEAAADEPVLDPEAAAAAEEEGRKATVEEKRKAAKNKAKGAPTFSKERMIAEAAAFAGIEPHVMAGALHDYEDDEITVADAKAACKAWLEREV